MKKKKVLSASLLAIFLLFAMFLFSGCSGINAGISELNGTAAPETDTSVAEVPKSKKYKRSQASLEADVKKYFLENDVMYQVSHDGSTVVVATDTISIQQTSTFVLMFGGSNYTAKMHIMIEADGTLTPFVKIYKSLAGFIDSEGNKYPEKENELRAALYAALDKG